jgi:tripartite-type tricarboxylate transporter receptor subunit TctC
MKTFERQAKTGNLTFFLPFGTLILFTLLLNGPDVWAAYPDRPINMVIAAAPGSGADFSGKIMGDRISKFLGQPLIAVYKPGGSGSLGSSFTAKAKPDGYTVLLGSTTPVALNPAVKKLDYRIEDFIFAGAFAKGLQWLAVKREARWNTLKDLVAEAKKSPNKILVATFGKLVTADVLRLVLNKQAGIHLIDVPFKSSGEEITALLGGHVQAAFISSPGAHLDSGTIRILAIAEKERVDALPNIPTFREAGYPIIISTVYSFCFPKRTPKEVFDRFCDAQQKAIQQYKEEIKTDLKKVEQFATFLSPEETRNAYVDLRETAVKFVKELKIEVK